MKLERIMSLLLVVGIVLFGKFYLTSDMLFFRLLAGVGLGHALSRGYTGFAGSVNRAYQTGSTKLMRTMTTMFFLTALFSTAVLFNADAKTFDLWINPINLGLVLGGLLFGFGMVFSSCCASGVLTDVVTAMPRGLITLIFFGAGVFLGFPLQASATWITDSLITSETGKVLGGGVYFPDLFVWDGMQGYLGAVLLTALLCGIVIYLSYRYEQYRKKQNTYSGHFMENIQEKDRQKPELDTKNYKFWSEETYNRLFANPWSLMTSAVVITGIFVLLMGVTKDGWGASTPYGFWFGRFLVGALYTPIANFSLSGWIFFIFIVAGGIVGNMVAKKAKL